MAVDVKMKMDLKALRQEAKMSAERVSQLSGVGRSNFERIETGTTPSLGNALRLARFLNVPVEEIWGLADD